METLLGLGGALALIVLAIMMSGSITNFIDFPSMMITVGGTLMAILAAYPMEAAMGLMGVFTRTFQAKAFNFDELINQIITLAEKARKEGLLALESDVANIEDDFLKRALQLVIDGTEPELVRTIMETELTYMDDRHRENKGIFEFVGSIAPAFGMIGTLIGLINMLATISDPETLTKNMGVALITSFYGATIANAFALPVAQKLGVLSSQEVLYKEIIIEGVLSIQAGENPRIIREKLYAFLPPKLRKYEEGE